MNRKTRELLVRGGKVSEKEMLFLLEQLPHEFVDEFTSAYFLGYTKFYLKEIHGYCVIYDEMSLNNDVRPSEKEEKEFYGRHELGVMEFYNLTLQEKFSGYKALLEHSSNAHYDRRLLEPRNDPEFYKIFRRGVMLSESDYEIFEKYIKYVDYSKAPQNIEAVIPLGTSEECRLKIGYYIEPNSQPFRASCRKLLYNGDFSYLVDGVTRKTFTN